MIIYSKNKSIVAYVCNHLKKQFLLLFSELKGPQDPLQNRKQPRNMHKRSSGDSQNSVLETLLLTGEKRQGLFILSCPPNFVAQIFIRQWHSGVESVA
jgi:hypothetical protein